MNNQYIDHGKNFDWGRVSSDYAKYRDIYPELFYQKIIELELCVSGQNVLDLGTGTGVLPRNLYQYGANFVGADISENQIAFARELSKEEGKDIKYLVSPAEEVDFPEKSFDVITACQCFIYFDKSIIPSKIHSLLKDGGHFSILSMVWLPAESEIAKGSEELVLKYNPSWTGAGFVRKAPKIPECMMGLFETDKAIGFDIEVPFTRESWHGRMKACRGIGASSLPEDVIVAFEQEHCEFLSQYPKSFSILHYASILSLRKVL